MKDEKSIFASRSVWGAAVAILAGGLGLAGFPIPGEHRGELADLLTQGAGLAGAAVAPLGPHQRQEPHQALTRRFRRPYSCTAAGSADLIGASGDA